MPGYFFSVDHFNWIKNVKGIPKFQFYLQDKLCDIVIDYFVLRSGFAKNSSNVNEFVSFQVFFLKPDQSARILEWFMKENVLKIFWT